jgi:hypothetical protein
MLYHTLKRVRYFPIAALLLTMLLFSSAWTPAYGSAEASKLLQDARMSAAQLRRDVTQMQTYARSRVGWESHAAQINLVKEHINKTGSILADLHKARDGAESWQQDAINRITPLLQEMASNTEAIIKHLNEKKQTWVPKYEGYLKSNVELANDLSKLIADSIDYDAAKARTHGMEKELGF